MAITDNPTAYGYERVNTEWSDADRAFFAMLRSAGLPVTFDVKQAFYEWRLSFSMPPVSAAILLLTESLSTMVTEGGNFFILE